jgi:hypothetical protein
MRRNKRGSNRRARNVAGKRCGPHFRGPQPNQEPEDRFTSAHPPALRLAGRTRGRRGRRRRIAGHRAGLRRTGGRRRCRRRRRRARAGVIRLRGFARVVGVIRVVGVEPIVFVRIAHRTRTALVSSSAVVVGRGAHRSIARFPRRGAAGSALRPRASGSALRARGPSRVLRYGEGGCK